MTDCVIIGSGMAGISAALTLKAQGVSFVLIGNPDLSMKIGKAEKITNYPAFCEGSGEALRNLLKRQLRENGIEVKAGRAVGVYAGKNFVSVQTDRDEWIEAKSAILACGVGTAVQAEGESEFLGRGVSYCATCDGALYKGKTIVAVAGSSAFEKEAEMLENFAGKFYFVPLYKNCTFQPKKSGTEIFTDGLVRIEGGLRAERAVFKNRMVTADGIFLLKDSVPLSAVCGGLKTDGRHVITDRSMHTNLKGVFAAGDCTGRPYQYAKAAGEGNVAAHSVTEYLRDSEHGEAKVTAESEKMP